MVSISVVSCIVLAVLTASTVDSQLAPDPCTTYGAVRLVGGQGSWEGNVQVCINNTWGWICQYGWGNNDARVICKQLGFGDPGGISRVYAYYGWPNASLPIWLDGVQCVNTENNIMACPRGQPIGNTRCNHNAIAGVVCQKGTGGSPCPNNGIRMLRSQTGTPFNGRGRIEVCYNGQWGTVCDDGWGTNDAKVACAQLGFSKNSAVRYGNAVFGQGYGSIVMRNVGCTSSENSLFSCSATFNSQGCGHNEDAGAACRGVVTTSCISGSVKLWRAYGIGPAHDGLALFCKNSQWAPVCDDSWKCDNGRLFCVKMGYAGLLNTRGEYHYGYYQGSVDHNAWGCTSSHTNLDSCPYYYHSSCNAYYDQIGIVCYSPIIGTACTEGSVRLVNGATPDQGRAEFCYEGNWYPFCDMNSRAALAVCNTLGYNASVATIYSDQRYGRTNLRSTFRNLNCPNTVQTVPGCSVVQKKTSCRVVVGKCGIEYGVGCHTPGNCTNGDMKLIDGQVEQEGRLEVCVNGVWGGVCGGNFDKSDAFVACTHLGFAGNNPTIRWGAYFGEGDGPVLINNVQCRGWETDFTTCAKQVFPAFWRCAPQWTIGLVCKDTCTWGSVRLTGGQFPNEGNVEICTGQWSYISDQSWTTNNAKVICKQLGYGRASAVAYTGSYYAKAKRPLRYVNVTCAGTENRLFQCAYTRLSYMQGLAAYQQGEVAGVDCIYDEATDPPCIQKPGLFESAPGTECVSGGLGSLRLTGGQQNADGMEGRLEYCYNGYWSPFCKLDSATASVACKHLGYTDYSWGAILDGGDYGILRNYSLFDNITCAGTESYITDCPAPYTNDSCTPYCRSANLGLRCFNKVAPAACSPEGAIRLVDAVIENEGRVEVCVQGVWGAVCDQGWDKTNAHVVCQQLGHPELEPVAFTNSEFGDGRYPIVYSNVGCGGWENRLADCSDRQPYLMTSCSRSNTAGVLCGYDCTDGDVRLVGSQYSYQGTVQICFDNLWGQISDAGWTLNDSMVVCRQLGFQANGTQASYGSQFGKSNFTIHLSDVSCTGNEGTLDDCTSRIYPLSQGKQLLQSASVNVAGVICYTPDQCVPPSQAAGSACTPGDVRLTGSSNRLPEGNLEYCYMGSWTPFCNLGPLEATVACRQLNFMDSDVAATFTDGRFGSGSRTSSFQQFSCASNPNAVSFSQCDLVDSCQSTCSNAVGLRCYSYSNCEDGDVRLVNGSFATEGRLEVCSNNIWGSVCSIGFDTTDAYVVCNELGLGNTEPIVYSYSYFGDGDGAILFSNFSCTGAEQSARDCPKQQYGAFTCSRDRVVGIICRDICSDSDVRLVGGNTTAEGTVEVCYYNTWGLVSNAGWGNEETQVVCRQLGYSNLQNAMPASFSKPLKPVQLVDVQCSGSEQTLGNCSSTILTQQESAAAYPNITAAGVRCTVSVGPTVAAASSNAGALAGMGLLIVALIVVVLVAIGLIIFVIYQKQRGFLSSVKLPQGSFDGFGTERGVTNPIAEHQD